MIAKATVFLTEDRTRAVAEGDPRAKFKLVHIGQEIPEAHAEKFEGAVELIGGKKKAPEPAPEKTIETREPAPHHRDPKHRKG